MVELAGRRADRPDDGRSHGAEAHAAETQPDETGAAFEHEFKREQVEPVTRPCDTLAEWADRCGPAGGSWRTPLTAAGLRQW